MPQIAQLSLVYQSQWFWLLITLGVIFFVVGVGMLELLICALQAYVFALLTSLYLNDAINLH